MLHSTTTSLTITTLNPHTTYICVIAAVTSAGVGPFSTQLTLQTPQARKNIAYPFLVLALALSTALNYYNHLCLAPKLVSFPPAFQSYSSCLLSLLYHNLIITQLLVVPLRVSDSLPSALPPSVSPGHPHPLTTSMESSVCTTSSSPKFQRE